MGCGQTILAAGQASFDRSFRAAPIKFPARGEIYLLDYQVSLPKRPSFTTYLPTYPSPSMYLPTYPRLIKLLQKGSGSLTDQVSVNSQFPESSQFPIRSQYVPSSLKVPRSQYVPSKFPVPYSSIHPSIHPSTVRVK